MAGCRLFHDTGALKPLDQLPQTFTVYESRPTPDHPWWESFGSRELNHLIHVALAQNLTLKQVLARLDQARARAVIEGAARYPDLTATAGTTRGRRWIRNETNDRARRLRIIIWGL